MENVEAIDPQSGQMSIMSRVLLPSREPYNAARAKWTLSRTSHSPPPSSLTPGSGFSGETGLHQAQNTPMGTAPLSSAGSFTHLCSGGASLPPYEEGSRIVLSLQEAGQ